MKILKNNYFEIWKKTLMTLVDLVNFMCMALTFVFELYGSFVGVNYQEDFFYLFVINS